MRISELEPEKKCKKSITTFNNKKKIYLEAEQELKSILLVELINLPIFLK